MTAIAITPTSGVAESAELSPQVKARVAGLLYLIIIVGGIFAQIFVRDRLVVVGNPAATARAITSHELLYRLGFSVEVFYLLCGIPLKILLYDLFKVVDRKLAVLTICFAFVGAAIQAVMLLAHYAPLVLLGKTGHETTFTAEQLQGAAYLSIRIFDYGYMIALAFFGCFCVMMGYLVVRSTFFPRFVGVLLWVEGALYLLNSFAHFIAPAVGDRVFPFLAVSGIAEISFCLTLLIAGVNVQRWREQQLRSAPRRNPVGSA
jgi:hypothetical protein